MTYYIFFGLLSSLIIIIVYVVYFWSIYKGETKPHMFSYIIWSITTGIVFVAQLVQGAGAGSWITGITFFFLLAIAYIGFRQREIVITKSDTLSLIAALGIIVVWIRTGDLLLAAFLSVIIDAIAYYPTFRKTYIQPYSENIIAYLLAAIAFSISPFAITNINFTTILYPIVCVILNMVFVGMVVLRRKSWRMFKK